MREIQNPHHLWIAAGLFEIAGVERFVCEQFRARGKTRLVPWQNGFPEIRARIGNAVANDANARGQKFFRVGDVVIGDDDAEAGLLNA